MGRAWRRRGRGGHDTRCFCVERHKERGGCKYKGKGAKARRSNAFKIRIRSVEPSMNLRPRLLIARRNRPKLCGVAMC